MADQKEISSDQRLWNAGIIPDWLRKEIGHLMKPIVLPWWLTKHEWKPFRTGDYEVSSLGDIRRATPGISTFVGRPLTPTSSPNGYKTVGIREGRFYVHRMVAEVFIGHCPDGHVVNHKDANKINNCIKNLEYVTPRENSIHAVNHVVRRRGPSKPKAPKLGRPAGQNHWTVKKPHRIARGESMRRSKVTEASVTEIRRRAAAGEEQKQLAGEFSLSVAQVSRIVRRLRWAHLGGQ